MDEQTNAPSELTVERLRCVLDEAVAGLTTLDAERLERIEEQLSAEVDRPADGIFAGRDPRKDDALRAVVATHRLLGSLLESTQVNLGVLEGLRRRQDAGGEQWAR